MNTYKITYTFLDHYDRPTDEPITEVALGACEKEARRNLLWDVVTRKLGRSVKILSCELVK